jgi:hypothetical protein
MDTFPLGEVVAALIALPSDDFAARTWQAIVAPEATTPDKAWDALEGPIAGVVLALLCAHPDAISAGDEGIGAIAWLLLHEAWNEYRPDELSDIVDLLSVFLWMGFRPAEFVEALRSWSAPAGGELEAQIRIRFVAAMFLAVGGDPGAFVATWIADREDAGMFFGNWIALVHRGWFSTDVFRALTIVAGPQLMGSEVTDGVRACLGRLERGEIEADIQPWNELLFRQPPGMFDWLQRCLHA